MVKKCPPLAVSLFLTHALLSSTSSNSLVPGGRRPQARRRAPGGGGSQPARGGYGPRAISWRGGLPARGGCGPRDSSRHGGQPARGGLARPAGVATCGQPARDGLRPASVACPRLGPSAAARLASAYASPCTRPTAAHGLVVCTPGTPRRLLSSQGEIPSTNPFLPRSQHDQVSPTRRCVMSLHARPRPSPCARRSSSSHTRILARRDGQQASTPMHGPRVTRFAEPCAQQAKTHPRR
jgi:hypothetical protein